MSAQIIDLLRFRPFVALPHVYNELREREQRLGPAHAVIFASPETKFWTHERSHTTCRFILSDAIGRQEMRRVGPRGEAIIEISAWRDFLDSACAKPDQFGKHGLAAFLAAHPDNCRHPYENRAWSAFDWASYNHAIDRAARKTFGSAA